MLQRTHQRAGTNTGLSGHPPHHWPLYTKFIPTMSFEVRKKNYGRQVAATSETKESKQYVLCVFYYVLTRLAPCATLRSMRTYAACAVAPLRQAKAHAAQHRLLVLNKYLLHKLIANGVCNASYVRRTNRS